MRAVSALATLGSCFCISDEESLSRTRPAPFPPDFSLGLAGPKVCTFDRPVFPARRELRSEREVGGGENLGEAGTPDAALGRLLGVHASAGEGPLPVRRRS